MTTWIRYENFVGSWNTKSSSTIIGCLQPSNVMVPACYDWPGIALTSKSARIPVGLVPQPHSNALRTTLHFSAFVHGRPIGSVDYLGHGLDSVCDLPLSTPSNNDTDTSTTTTATPIQCNVPTSSISQIATRILISSLHLSSI